MKSSIDNYVGAGDGVRRLRDKWIYIDSTFHTKNKRLAVISFGLFDPPPLPLVLCGFLWLWFMITWFSFELI